ncbi:hypothetical protein ACIOG8_18415 [Streptomyces erythrochromogenes]|uniref:hypothetical protein n=1 Tax=Streptomyces erythrochromogenes TaxID=285574 RepID=UPI00381B9DBE
MPAYVGQRLLHDPVRRTPHQRRGRGARGRPRQFDPPARGADHDEIYGYVVMAALGPAVGAAGDSLARRARS